MEIPSKLIQDAVEQFSSLPGIGKKTALRLTLFLLNQDKTEVNKFGESFINLRNNIKFCASCHNVCEETDLCSICSNPLRVKDTVCVVETLKDLIAIERTQQIKGTYHILGGIISPMDGIGPADINVESLVTKCETGEVKEVILALPTTMEGDTTNFYLYKRLKSTGVEITAIARGVAIGDELEYTDEITLGRSIADRKSYSTSLHS